VLDKKKSLDLGDDTEFRIDNLIPNISAAVRLTCVLHKYKADKNEIEDLCQQILLLLLEDNNRRLRSFNNEKASINTWLKTVIFHYLSRQMLKEPVTKGIEDREINLISDLPSQEQILIYQERAQKMKVIVNKLANRERELYKFLCRDDLSVAEIAKQMSIKTDSVYRRKHALIRKLQSLLQTTDLNNS
jgi:RNA polymerase sigma factor (sigma-70 family)